VPLFREAARRLSAWRVAALRLPPDRVLVGGCSAVDRLADCPAGAVARGLHARLARPVDVVVHQAARELRRGDDLRDFPDVLRLVGALSPVARPRVPRAAVADLLDQPGHPRACGYPRTPVRPASPGA